MQYVRAPGKVNNRVESAEDRLPLFDGSEVSAALP